MRGNPRHLRRNRLIIAASAAALVAVTTIGIRPVRVEIVPGNVVPGSQASDIEALTYLNDSMMFKARRTGPSGPFTVRISYNDGRAPQQCMASLDLDEVLHRMVHAQVKRQLSPRQAEAEFPVKLGTLQLEDRISRAPMPAFTVRTRKDQPAIALIYDQVAVETSTPPEVFTKLGVGCTALASK